MSVCRYVHTHAGAFRVQKRASDPLELEFWAAETHVIRLLVSELRSFA